MLALQSLPRLRVWVGRSYSAHELTQRVASGVASIVPCFGIPSGSPFALPIIYVLAVRGEEQVRWVYTTWIIAVVAYA